MHIYVGYASSFASAATYILYIYIYISKLCARVNCIMQISVIPGESSAGGKRSIKIHGRRWMERSFSRVSATTVSSNCIFRASSAARRIAALGIPGIEWIPRYLLAPIPRVFSPGNKVLSVVAELTYARVRRCHFSRCTLLLRHSCMEKRSGRDAFIHVSSLLLHRASRRAVRKAVSASPPLSVTCFSLARKQVGAHVRGYALNKSRSVNPRVGR